MRYPKIIDELNDSVVTIVQLVLTIHNPIAFVKNYVRMNVGTVWHVFDYDKEGLSLVDEFYNESTPKEVE